MNKIIITLLIVLACSLCCLSMVSADDNATDNITLENIENMNDYIIPVHITDNGIEFSDGFVGFCIDSAKSSVTVNDNFTSQPAKDSDVENHIKLAIIEAYKAGKEDNLGDIVSQVIAKNKENDIVKAVFDSTQTVDDTAVELLNSLDDSKSDCLAYKVSFKTIENSPVLGVANNEVNESAYNESTDNESAKLESTSEDATAKVNDTQDNTSAAGNDDAKSDDDQTIINETNKTIINKTNTVIVNENNTTVINKNTTKVINKTNDNPQNATVQQKIMRTVGNPIFLLAIVIVIIAIVGVVMRRKN